jgi:hypothetical protein
MADTGWRRWTLWSLVALVVVVGGIAFVQWLVTIPVGVSDFNAYWAASRLLLEGRNPSDPDNMLKMERDHFNPDQDFVMMTWNPPTLWVFMLPLARMPFEVARSIWMLVNVALIVVSCLMLGLVYLPKGHVAPLLTYYLVMALFSPMLLVILTGQIVFLVVFGVAASMFLIKRERWFWAGAVLILTSVKPHLVMLVTPYLMFYMAMRRKWAGWIGLGVAGAVCLVILFILRPSWIVDFSALLDAPPINWATPTIGAFLGLYGVGPWLRYVGIGFLLLLPVFLCRPKPVSLETSASVLILLTIPTTFFGWSYDQSLLLVPIAQIVGWLFGSVRSVMGRSVVIAAMVVTMVVNMAQRVAKTSEVYFFWVPLAWGVIYALASWLTDRRGAHRLRKPVDGNPGGLRE